MSAHATTQGVSIWGLPDDFPVRVVYVEPPRYTPPTALVCISIIVRAEDMYEDESGFIRLTPEAAARINAQFPADLVLREDHRAGDVAGALHLDEVWPDGGTVPVYAVLPVR